MHMLLSNVHTCNCSGLSPHLSVNRELVHVYSVQCTQCIHRNAMYVMLQNSDNVYASREHSDILRNVLHI